MHSGGLTQPSLSWSLETHHMSSIPFKSKVKQQKLNFNNPLR